MIDYAIALVLLSAVFGSLLWVGVCVIQMFIDQRK
jgi:hypothetical protein